MKKILILVLSLCCVLSLGGVVYADDSVNSDTNNVSSSNIISSSSVSESTSTTGEKSSIGTTKKATIGYSSFNVVVSNDDMFSGLETLLDTYTTEYYAPQMTTETKLTILKLLTSLVISCATGDSSYTLESFKEAFVQILVEHGINITDDVIDAITKYAVHYLEDDLEEDDTEDYLVWIGGGIGMMTTLFITSQMGGVHRA